MAGIKIVDLPALGRDLISTDLLEVSLNGSGSRKITGQEIMNASKLAVGSTPIVSGTVGRLLFQNTGDVLGQSANLFWDNTNGRLGIGTTSPSTGTLLDVIGTIKANVLRSDVLNNTSNTITLIYFTGTGNRLYDNSGTQVLNLRGGNLQINTTTDAGYRLDVNGTARVQGALSVTSNIVISAGAGITAPFFNGTVNNFQFGTTAIFLTQTNSVAVASGLRSAFLDTIVWQQSSGTGEFASFRATPTLNTTGTYVGIVRGFHYKPTITSLTGATHYAIHTEAGRVRFENLPTSATGLSAGDIWNDAGTLKIV